MVDIRVLLSPTEEKLSSSDQKNKIYIMSWMETGSKD